MSFAPFVESSWKRWRNGRGAAMSGGRPCRPVAGALLDRLPRKERDRLILIGRQGRGIFERFDFQRIVETDLNLFEYLVDAGATATMIGQLLAEVGIVRADRSPLPPGTVSSALSRARERSARVNPAPIHAAAGGGMHMLPPAASGRAPQANAAIGMPLQGPAAPLPGSPGPPHTSERRDSPIRPPPNGPAGLDLPVQTRRAAALLESLRSNEDESESSS
jgi:hypothetical protein